MKRLGVFLHPLDGVSSPVPIDTPGWREPPWESCTRTQHKVPLPGFDTRPLDLETSALTMRTSGLPTKCFYLKGTLQVYINHIPTKKRGSCFQASYNAKNVKRKYHSRYSVFNLLTEIVVASPFIWKIIITLVFQALSSLIYLLCFYGSGW